MIYYQPHNNSVAKVVLFSVVSVCGCASVCQRDKLLNRLRFDTIMNFFKRLTLR